MELEFGSALQAILIIVLIIQTTYLARQTNFFRRSSQSALTESWNKELASIKSNILYPEDPNELPDENEFDKLVQVLHRMHNQFKDKLLKPSDFAIFFVILYSTTKYEKLRQTNTYRENHLRLQIIFDDFSKDVDAVMYFFTIANTSTYEEILGEVGLFKKYDSLKKAALKDWLSTMRGFKIGIWWNVKVKRKQTFELEPPITEDKSKKET